MSKVNTDARLPQTDDIRALKQKVFDNHKDIATQVNAISENRLVGTYNAVSAVPTNGSFAQGDFVRNSIPVELGAISSKYVVFGWLCVSPDPLLFVDMRFLTGN